MSELIVEKLKAEHLFELFKQENARPFARHYTLAHAKHLEDNNLCYTAFMDGEIVACGGAVEYWKDRGEAWAIFGKTHANNFILIQRACKKIIEFCPLRRLEASILINFEEGHRWIKSMGFELETPLARAYTQDGEDCAIYSRVRDN